jgi:catechol 2,3-dioxygenase-like lactoylglutathione lyase family enzyme
MTEHVTEKPRIRVAGTTLDAPDPPALARFYQRLLGWEPTEEDPAWVQLRPPGGGRPSLSFQLEPLYRPPTWPTREGAQQMMSHLDIEVDDLDAAVAFAVAGGATVAEFQPQQDVRVLFDPAGHPFCLFLPGD